MILTPSCTTGVKVSAKMVGTPSDPSWIPTVPWDKEMDSLTWMFMRSTHSMIVQVRELNAVLGEKNKKLFVLFIESAT